MNTIHLVLFASALSLTSSMIGMSTLTSIAGAQTPTTSDLPSNIGNESKSDMELTNNTATIHNTTTTTTYASPPL